MGKVYTPTSVGSGVQTTTSLNSNFTNIETALQDVLSRSGAAPNAMAADLDMGNNDILNGNTGNFVDIVVGGTSIVAQVTAAAASAAAALASESAAAISESNAATSESNASASATLASQWAMLTGGLVAATDYSSKEYAIGTFTRGSVGSAKDWATLTGATVNASEVSAREWARGTYNVGLTNGGSARMWATYTGGTADDTEYSAKEYAIGTNVATGSAKDWAQEAEDVLVDGSGYSAFHWAQKAMAIVGGVAGLVSSNDTTADYLVNKFTALHGLTWTEINDGGNEDLQISIGTHLEIGGGANLAELNVYKSDSTGCNSIFQNLTTGNTASDGFKVGINSSEQAQLWNYENTDIIFATNNVARMYIKAGGQLSIGADLSNAKLNIHDASSGNNYAQFTNTTTGTGAADGLAVGINASEQAIFLNRENTLMKFSTNATDRFIIAADGGLYTNGATGASQGADTINASDFYKDGQIVTGSTLTTSNELKRGYTVYTTDKDYEPGGAYGSITISSIATADTWESLGPVGSGADNTDAYLDPLDDLNSPSGILYHSYALGTIATGTYGTGYVSFNMDKTSISSYGGCSFKAYNGDSLGRAHQAQAGGILSCPSTGIIGVKWGDNVNVSSPSMELQFNGFVEGEAD